MVNFHNYCHCLNYLSNHFLLKARVNLKSESSPFFSVYFSMFEIFYFRSMPSDLNTWKTEKHGHLCHIISFKVRRTFIYILVLPFGSWTLLDKLHQLGQPFWENALFSCDIAIYHIEKYWLFLSSFFENLSTCFSSLF